MSEQNLPEKQQASTAPAPVPLDQRAGFDPEIDGWAAMLPAVASLSNEIAPTEFVPEGLRGNVAGTTAGILYGREVGIPPMTMLQQMHLVNGKVGISAEAMRALVLREGHEIVFREMTGAKCLIAGRRKGSQQWTEVTWTIDMAKAAQIAGKAVWKQYPRAMLAARATVELCRLVFPDVIHGLRATEEIDDIESPAGGGEPASSGSTKVGRGRKKTIAKPPTKKATAEPPAPDLPDDEPVAEEPRKTPAKKAATKPAQRAESKPAPVEDAAPPLPEPDPEPDVDEGQDDDVVDAEIVDEAEDGGGKLTQPQLRAIMPAFKNLDITDREERLHIVTVIVGRDITSTSDLTKDEASGLLDTLAFCETGDDLRKIVEATAAHESRKAGEG